MRHAFAVVLACFVFGSVSMSYGQCTDPYDANLCVYPVTNAPANIRDGVISAFWNDWGGKDYIEMIAPDDCYPDRCGFVGSDDALLTIKAAATNIGLYVLSTVTDNTWVDKASADDWGADAIDFFFDAMDANAIWTCTGCTIGLYDSKLTYTTQQFQVWMGASASPTGCRMAYYDEILWSWQTIGLTWNELSVLYKIEIDVINIDATHKAQEWFFPWTAYGKGLAIGTNLDGMKLGISGGYNDKDGDNANPDCLRWLGKDPWSGTVNYWGDFVLQSGIGAVDTNTSAINQRSFFSTRFNTVNRPSDFYTLQGKKVATGTIGNVVKNAVLVKNIGYDFVVSIFR